MKIKNSLVVSAICGAFIALAVCGCNKNQAARSPEYQGASSQAPRQPAALPENGFKANITLVDPPAKLRAGQKQTVQVRVKNASDVIWYARGAAVNTNPDNKFYLAVGDRWLKAANQALVTEMDGRYGLDRDLKPGEETEVPLQITAPKEPGAYILEVDLVQEQVAWFHDKGSPTTKSKVTVVR
jgi:hypothetical protein